MIIARKETEKKKEEERRVLSTGIAQRGLEKSKSPKEGEGIGKNQVYSEFKKYEGEEAFETNESNGSEKDEKKPESVFSLDEDSLEQGSSILAYQDFESMSLKNNILRGIYSMGYEKPSPIQERGIVAIKTGKDVIAQSQSGTGKTATFVIGILSLVDEDLFETQALVLSPTRELANQSFKVCQMIGDYTNITMHNCIGGTNVREEKDKLATKPNIIIGTPGRILHMAEEGYLDTNHIKVVVLDEMDVLLDRGFKDSIHDIFQQLRSDIQVVLISATMPIDALEMSKKFMREPLRIILRREVISLPAIKQFYIELDEDSYKFETLLDIYESVSVSQSVIFCNTIRRAEELDRSLRDLKYSVSVIHSNMTTEERASQLQRFKKVETRVLISTDVLARGIDVQGVSIVINYDVPTNRENYIHRIGRCGRYGRKGVAINFVRRDEMQSLRSIEKFYNTVVEELPTNFTKFIS